MPGTDGTLTFDLRIEHKPVTGGEYTKSMLPQIRLNPVTDVQATSFTMDCTIKFRGEPLKTIYGFCWSTSRNPKIRDQNFILAHREWYRGHAIHLNPNTTYYVRAFATNGLGIRYSDEEEVVKTAHPAEPPANIGPLLTDAFSQNRYLFRRCSNASSEWLLDYSPVCTLAKLVAYYRSGRFPAARQEESRQSLVDFNPLSWNPGEDDNPKRLLEIDAFFGSVYGQINRIPLTGGIDDQKLQRHGDHLALPGQVVSPAFQQGLGCHMNQALLLQSPALASANSCATPSTKAPPSEIVDF